MRMQISAGTVTMVSTRVLESPLAHASYVHPASLSAGRRGPR